MKKVSFIGNSHTYGENLPWLFADVCRQGGVEVYAVMCAQGGCDWQWHLTSHCALPNLRYGNYDFTVIQQKAHPFDGAEMLIEQGSPLIMEIQAVKTKAVLFNTWSEKNNPDGQKIIDDAHNMFCELFDGCLIARCGPAWHSLRGIIDLYDTDGLHQNSCGAYLNACVLAKTIFAVDPLALPDEIETKTLTRTLTKDEIRLLQKTAAVFA
ncbi:MAG: hypothetical protein FWD71_00465 [Oscillospiraceae bacterium]|nr:hypothetical protein [Oscillospiraceae bacterium]